MISEAKLLELCLQRIVIVNYFDKCDIGTMILILYMENLRYDEVI